MRKLTIVALGSSPLIAQEIKNLTQEILGDSWPIDLSTTAAITKAAPDTFYVCAITQGAKLQNIIPAKQLFILDLHPTTRFFLDIAQIPSGSDIYVFNNLLPYTQILAQDCQDLGLTSFTFHSIAYDEMPVDEVCAKLSQAHYIIGVACMLGKEALLSEKFRHALQPNVKIIPGQRSATIQCAGKLLTAIADFYLANWAAADDTKDNQQELLHVINALKSAASRAVTSRLGTSAPLPAFEKNIAARPLAEQQSVLAYLAKKLAHLGGSPYES